MSELINGKNAGGDFRWQLMATVSAAALFLCAAGPHIALARDDDRPTVWIELGGQLEQSSNSVEPFAPPFITEHLGGAYNAVSPLSAERFPRFGFGGEGSISFQPQESDWVFTAGIRYGRSNGGKRLHQQTATQFKRYIGTFSKYLPVTHWDEAITSTRETHAVLDFKVGKDVGLGLFGHGSTSSIGFGVRYAQFSANATSVFRSLPDQYYPKAVFGSKVDHHHSYYAHQNLSHNFRGIGPSVSWTGSSRLAGNAETSELALDWGANAAVLFGRQKVSGSHQTTGIYYTGLYNAAVKSQYHAHIPVNRSHSVVVPNVGGQAAVSFRHGPARVSFGYRADFFFGAMDGGIDARKTDNRDFYGPFATVSVGLGG